MRTLGLTGAQWVAVLRIGLGLWWLESFRHKDKRAWIERNAGIAWASSVAEKHRWGAVRRAFQATAGARPRTFTWVVLLAELALGLGVTLGLLSPVALVASALLNLTYFVLMIHDWAEQGQNLMMILVAVVALGTRSWYTWSLDKAFGLFGA